MKNNKVQWFILALAAGFLVVSIGSWLVMTTRFNSSVSAMQTSLQDAKDKYAQAQQEAAAEEEKAIEEASHINTARIDQDQEQLSEFFKQLCTWDSSTTYIKAREELLNQNDISSEQLNKIMPELSPFPSYDPETSEISYYYELDVTDQNVSYRGLDLYLIGINQDTYHYLAFVDVDVQKAETVKLNSELIFTLNVNGNGTISDIEGYSIAEVQSAD